jgi:hypothetical protein
MATAMTFTSLQQDIWRYLERGFTQEDDPIVYSQIPRLINTAERRIARELKIQGFISAVTTTLSSGVAVYSKPDRWRDTISMFVLTDSGRVPLFSRSYEYLRNYWPNSSETAQPQFYADYDYSHWLIVPTPNESMELEILYYQSPPLLDDTNQTNWLTAYAPDLLLYACLLESTVFLKNDERKAVWEDMYNRAAQGTNNQDLQKILDRNAVRSEV